MEAIKIDLPRTFPENIVFGRYRRPLFNVLIASASYNPDIGYCQGLNYIAGEHIFSFCIFFTVLRILPQSFHPGRSLAASYKEWRTNILVTENSYPRCDKRLLHKNNVRTHWRYFNTRTTSWSTCSSIMPAHWQIRHDLNNSYDKVVYLLAFGGTASRNNTTCMGLSILWRKKGIHSIGFTHDHLHTSSIIILPTFLICRFYIESVSHFFCNTRMIY